MGNAPWLEVGVQVVFAFACLAVLAFAMLRAPRASRAWSRLARQLGTVEVTTDARLRPVLTGTFEGQEVRAELGTRSLAEPGERVTFVSAPCRRPLPHDFVLRPASWRGAPGQGMTTGDPSFDQTFTVHASRPEAARALLASEATRRELMSGAAREPSLTVDRGRVLTEHQGPVTDPTDLRAMLETVTRAAASLERAASAVAPSGEAAPTFPSVRWVRVFPVPLSQCLEVLQSQGENDTWKSVGISWNDG